MFCALWLVAIFGFVCGHFDGTICEVRGFSERLCF